MPFFHFLSLCLSCLMAANISGNSHCSIAAAQWHHSLYAGAWGKSRTAHYSYQQDLGIQYVTLRSPAAELAELVFASGLGSNGNRVQAEAAWGPWPLVRCLTLFWWKLCEESACGLWNASLFRRLGAYMQTFLFLCVHIGIICVCVCDFIQRVLSLPQSALACSHALDRRHPEWHYRATGKRNVYFDPALQPKHVRDYPYQIYLYLSASVYRSSVWK